MVEEVGALDAALSAFTDTDAPGLAGVQMMHEALRERRLALVSEAQDAARPRLRLTLDGGPVARHANDDHSVNVHSLVNLVGPFDESVRAIGQALSDGPTKGGIIPASVTELVALRLHTTFVGSFGLELSGPPVPEFEALRLPISDEPEPLFDAAVGRVLDVVQAASNESSYEQELIEQVAGLGQRSLKHLQDLAKRCASERAVIAVEWVRPDLEPREVSIDAGSALRLQQVLSSIKSSEVTRPIAGRLVEASIPHRRFGIETEGEGLLRGSVHPDVAHRIEEFFGQEVTGDLLVTTTASTVSDRSAQKLTLLNFVGPM